MNILINTVNLVFELFSVLVIIHVIISYFMPVEHPVRSLLSRIIEPFLTPIRSRLPQTGGIDFSPMILIILLILVRAIIVGLLQL